MSQRMRNGSCVVLGMAVLASIGLTAGAQNAPQETDQQEQQQQTRMQCPMMESLQGIQLHAETPAVLLAQEEELQLTAQQKQQLAELAEQSRRRAREVLTDQQREELAKAPSGALSPMQLMKMQMKGRMTQMRSQQEGKGPMCPMCMRMMQQRMQEGQDAVGQQDEQAEQHADKR